MNARRLAQIAVCLTVSATVTAAIDIGDFARQSAARTERALRWARQISAQAESLALEARANPSEQDPVGRAARLLSQGTDARILSVTRFQASSGAVPETYAFDPDKGVFEYSKSIDLQENTGVKIRIASGPSGFLGIGSLLGQDLALTGIFLFVFLLGMAYTGPAFGFRRRLVLDALEFRERIVAWIGEAKTVLTELGNHVREMIRQASRLASAARKSRESVSTLRENVHAKLRGARLLRQLTAADLKTALRAEVIARHLAQRLRAPEPDAIMVQAMSAELHRLVLALLESEKRNAEFAHSTEREFEPIATDADLALHSYDDVFCVTDALSSEVRRTTEKLLDQARLVRDLKESAASRK